MAFTGANEATAIYAALLEHQPAVAETMQGLDIETALNVIWSTFSEGLGDPGTMENEDVAFIIHQIRNKRAGAFDAKKYAAKKRMKVVSAPETE